MRFEYDNASKTSRAPALADSAALNQIRSFNVDELLPQAFSDLPAIHIEKKRRACKVSRASYPE